MRLIPVTLMAAILFGFLAVPSSLSVQAQSFGVDEDLEFARGLMARRMHDLAKVILDRIRENPDNSDGEKASANLEIANLHKDKFGRGLSFEERLQASEEADAAYRDFITNFSDHPRIVHAKFEYGEFLVYLGRYRIQLYENTLLTGGEREKAEEHRDIALEKLKKAADIFDELRVLIPASGKENDPEYKDFLDQSRYFRTILYYDIGKAEKDEANRLSTFSEGINNLEDYIFENEDNLRGFWGYLYKGLCHREFSEDTHKNDALACFEGVLYAFENSIKNPESGWSTWADVMSDPGAKQLLENTFWRFAETLNRFGQYQKASEKIQKFQDIMKEAKVTSGNTGFRALLERAESSFLTDDVSNAISIVSDVSTLAGISNRFIQFHCDRYLARFLDEVEDKTKLDATVVFKAAKGAYGQERYYDALRHFQTVLAIKKGVGDVALDCWYFIGRCYRNLGFLRESALATASGAFNLKSADPARAMDMARGARNTLAKIAKQTGSKKDREALNNHKDRMDQVFGSVSGANYDPAFQKMQEGLYAKAIEDFQRITKDAEKYELARGYITFCMAKLAEKNHDKAVREAQRIRKGRKAALEAAETAFEEALKKTAAEVDSYLGFVKRTPIHGEPVKKNNRNQAMGIAYLSKVVALKGLKKWNEGLTVLGYFSGGSVTNKDQLMTASILRTQLCLGKKMLKEAEQELKVLKARYPGKAQKFIISIQGQLGMDLKAQAETLEKAGKRVPALNARLKSVALRHAWVKGISPKIENLYSLAKDLYDLNRFDEAKSYLDAILNQWGSVEKPRRKLRKSLRLTKLYLARCLVWQGKYVEAEPIFRALYEAKKNDRGLLKEYASLLTGTVKFIDGKFLYIPGRGAHKKDAMVGFNLWRRVAKTHERGNTEKDFREYLCARFHQNLVRWAQGKASLANKSLKQLRNSLGQNLDRKPKSRKPGYWEKRFDWLERSIRQKAPQTPPEPPAPLGILPK